MAIVKNVNVTVNPFPPAIIAAAQKAQEQTHMPASVTLAQWAQESGYGKHMPYNSNNPFGIKWTPYSRYPFEEAETNEWDGHKYVEIMAKFVKYPSIDEAFHYHGQMLMNPSGPYKSTLGLVGNIDAYVPAMAKIYATDPNYGHHLLILINQYGLRQYDAKVVADEHLF